MPAGGWGQCQRKEGDNAEAYNNKIASLCQMMQKWEP
jgi:hypothetical protein